MTGAPSAAPEIEREVRLAVVMYGGVSLAIYINGVSQELLRLVRATARARGPNGEVLDEWAFPVTESTETIYREMAKRSRVVIDVIAGTSAGGINGIFLAKALACESKLDTIASLWITEGDLSSLINDPSSYVGVSPADGEPASLLNSTRMYVKLLDALDGMTSGVSRGGAETDPNTGGPLDSCKSRLVDDLDLYVTATDIEGVPLPLQLSDAVVYERRHRNVLHFCYLPRHLTEAGDRNDLDAPHNPFLAYAARCTSAFPFAFEPMCLCDIDRVLAAKRGYRGKSYCKSDSKYWQRYYQNYIEPAGVPIIEFPQRAFGDGGYLDNKPFSHAIDALIRRESDVPVERKLVYIEPSPEHPEEEPLARRKPNAIENSLAALVGVPRYETIREDLQRVVDRNLLLQRVNGWVSEMEGAIAEGPQERRSDGSGLATDSVTMLGNVEDACRAAYRRLRVADVTDQLSGAVARAFRYEPGSAFADAIATIVRAWRDTAYPLSIGANNRYRFVNFLEEFDLPFRIRRLRFVLRKAHRIAYLTSESSRDDPAADSELSSMLLFGSVSVLEDKAALHAAVVAIRRRLYPAYAALRRFERALSSNAAVQDWLQKRGEDSGITFDDLCDVIGAKPSSSDRVPLGDLFQPEGGTAPDMASSASPPEAGELPRGMAPQRFKAGLAPEAETAQRRVRAARVLGRVGPSVDRVAQSLKERLRATFTKSADTVSEALPPRGHEAVTAAHNVLRRYYDEYEEFDCFLFPTLYQTPIGEGQDVGIFRISPEDATAVVDDNWERRNHGLQKLRGLVVAHFGAFLEKQWRENDMLWGRLDGAERLITMLEPDPTKRKARIVEAMKQIVAEEVQPRLLRALGRDAMSDPSVRTLPAQTKQRYAEALKDAPPGAKIMGYREGVPDEPERRGLLRNLARSTTVVGRMLDTIKRQQDAEFLKTSWLTAAGRVFWGLIEVAAPRRPGELLFRYWLQLIYAFEVFLIAAGLLLQRPGATQFGWTALGVTLVVNAVVVTLNRYMVGAAAFRRILRAFKVLLGGAVVLLVVLGGIYAYRISSDAGGRVVPTGVSVPSWVPPCPALAVSPRSFAAEVIGALALLVLGYGALMQSRMRFVRTGRLPHRLQSPMLAMEFVSSSRDVEAILGTGPVGLLEDPNRTAMRKAVSWDNGFVLLYTLLYFAIGSLLQKEGGWRETVGLAVWALAGMTAVADWCENVGIVRVTRKPIDRVTDRDLHLIWIPATVKWVLTFVILLLASQAFLWTQDIVHVKMRLFFAGISLLLVVAGLTGLIGVAGEKRAIRTAMTLSGLALLLAGVSLPLCPTAF